MAFERKILEDYSDLDLAVDEIQETAGADYTGRMHIEPEYDAADDALRSLLEEFRYDDETAEEIYEDLQETDLGDEQIKEVLIDHTDIDPRELSPVDRRQFLKLAAGAAGASYLADAGLNKAMLESSGQSHYDAPAGSYHGEAVDSILDGEDFKAHIFNISLEDGRTYDGERVVNEVESSLAELEEVNPAIEYYDIHVTPETISDALDTDMDFAQIAYENLENGLENNTVTEIEPSFIEGYVDKLIDYEARDIQEEDVKVGILDFKDSQSGGVSTTDIWTGSKDWALSEKKSEDELIQTLTHELGHKLGLPHTKYPDLKRGGFLPDIMSYSKGTVNALDRARDAVTGNAFGKQSHYNWREVREFRRSL